MSVSLENLEKIVIYDNAGRILIRAHAKELEEFTVYTDNHLNLAFKDGSSQDIFNLPFIISWNSNNKEGETLE